MNERRLSSLLTRAAVVAVATVALASGARAVVVTHDIAAAADGFVQSSGILGLSSGDAGNPIRTSMSGGNNVRHGIFEFDLSSIPDTATLISATLHLQTFGLISNVGSAPGTVTYGTYLGDGTVSTADFNAGTTTVASEVYGTGTNSPPAGTIMATTFGDLTDVLAAIAGTGGDILGVETSTHNFVTFNVHSLETTTSTALVPTLVIEYDTAPGATRTPAPGPVALLGLGLLGLAALRRRRH